MISDWFETASRWCLISLIGFIGSWENIASITPPVSTFGFMSGGGDLIQSIGNIVTGIKSGYILCRIGERRSLLSQLPVEVCYVFVANNVVCRWRTVRAGNSPAPALSTEKNTAHPHSRAPSRTEGISHIYTSLTVERINKSDCDTRNTFAVVYDPYEGSSRVILLFINF